VGGDVFVLRSNSELQISGDGFLISGMCILTGKLLSVFGERTAPHRISTLTATIGIRGTGFILNQNPTEATFVLVTDILELQR
jgi:hypothetical protein